MSEIKIVTELADVKGEDDTSTRSDFKVVAIVVIYHPEWQALKKLIDVLKHEVDQVYVFDNTPIKEAGKVARLPSGNFVRYFSNEGNLGLATAQNQGIKLAAAAGATHVFLLDQDSFLPRDTVSKLLESESLLIRSGAKVAAIGPVFVDRKSGVKAPRIKKTWYGTRKEEMPSEGAPESCAYIISSGSLIRTSVFNEVGSMRDELFIDWVDIEWCERAALKGYVAYLVPGLYMDHSIGDETRVLLGRRINLHSDTRNYFIVRNAVYLGSRAGVRLAARIQMLKRIPYYVICYSWCSASRPRALKLMLFGIYDGCTGRMGAPSHLQLPVVPVSVKKQ